MGKYSGRPRDESSKHRLQQSKGGDKIIQEPQRAKESNTGQNKASFSKTGGMTPSAGGGTLGGQPAGDVKEHS